MQPCDTVVKHPLPCGPTEDLKCLKFLTVNLVPLPVADDFPTTVTECVVRGVYKVVTRSSFGVLWPYKVSGGKWTFLPLLPSSDTFCRKMCYAHTYAGSSSVKNGPIQSSEGK